MTEPPITWRIQMFYPFNAIDVNAEDVVTVDNIANSCSFGDLGQLNSRIDTFNKNYSLDIGYTKGFAFKPGTVDKIAKTIGERLYIVKAPESSYQTGNRTTKKMFDGFSGHRWWMRTFRSNYEEINDLLSRVRKTGLTFENHTESLKEIPDQFLSFMVESNEMLENFDAKVSLKEKNADSWHTNDPTSMHDSVFMFEITIKHPIMKVLGNSDDHLGDIPFPGDITIMIYQSLRDTINAYGFKMNNRIIKNGVGVNIRAIHSAGSGLHHPFLGYANDGHVCTGNLSSNLQNAFRRLEFMELVTNIDLWMTTFKQGTTYPLNRLNMMFFGLPDSLTTHLKDSIGQDSGECSTRVHGRFNNYKDSGRHCNDIECTLRDECNMFNKYFSNEEEWVKQAEQVARREKIQGWLEIIYEEYTDIEFEGEDESQIDYYWEVGMEHELEGMRRAGDLERSSHDMNLFMNRMTEGLDPSGYYRGDDLLEVFRFHPDTVFVQSREFSIHEPHNIHSFVHFMFNDHGIDVVYNTLLEAMDYRDMYLEAEAKITPEDSAVVDSNTQEEMLNWAAAITLGARSTT